MTEDETFWNDAMLMESLATESVRFDQEVSQFTNDYFELNPKPKPLFAFKVQSIPRLPLKDYYDLF